MPEIKIEIAEEVPKPVEGKIYIIQEVEFFTSTVRSYKGLRVTMVGEANETVVETLWTREIAGVRSKVGAFIHALGKETDAWKGKHIRLVEWHANNRKIEVVQ